MAKTLIKHSSHLGAYVQNRASIFRHPDGKTCHGSVESASIALRDIVDEAVRLRSGVVIQLIADSSAALGVGMTTWGPG